MYTSYVTIDLIRDVLMDRTPADNTIDCDLFVSDEEILKAMDRAAAEYNSLPPLGVDHISPGNMPADTNIFVDAVISRIYAAELHRLARNIMAWRTGDTSVELEKTRYEYFAQLKKELDASWKELALQRKMEKNRELVWRSF